MTLAERYMVSQLAMTPTDLARQAWLGTSVEIWPDKIVATRQERVGTAPGYPPGSVTTGNITRAERVVVQTSVEWGNLATFALASLLSLGKKEEVLVELIDDSLRTHYLNSSDGNLSYSRPQH